MNIRAHTGFIAVLCLCVVALPWSVRAAPGYDGEPRGQFAPRTSLAGAIGDFIWYDANANGVEDIGEPGIANVTVNLYLDDGNGVFDPPADLLAASTVTSANGGYLFSGLAPGVYFVAVSDLHGVLTGMQRVIGMQSQPNPAAAIYLGQGEVNKDADFAYVLSPAANRAVVGDVIWHDADGDGFQQPGEPGIADLEVCGTPAGDAAVCTVTDSNGVYRLELAAGVYAIAASSTPPGLAATTATPLTMTVTAGQQELNADFGYRAITNTLGEIGNLVFLDANQDGIFGAGDAPLPGVSLDLIHDTNGDGVWDPTEPVIATATTRAALDGAGGNYRFTGVPAGAYLVHVSDLIGILLDFHTSPLGSPGADGHAQADPLPVSLAGGQSYLAADFGFYPSGSAGTSVIGDQLWIDVDGDGRFDPGAGDFGQPGVVLALLEGEDILAYAITGADGGYAFLGVPAGVYAVQVYDDFGVLTSLHPTLPGPMPGANDNNQAQPYTVTVPAAGLDLTADFGYAGRGAILGTVYYDWNQDGMQQPTEAGAPGIRVDLYADADRDGQRDSDASLAFTLTDSQGNYIFADQLPGDYVVIESGGGLLSSAPGGRPVRLIVRGAIGLSKGNDFGDLLYVRLSGRAWLDVNVNGAPDPGEIGNVSGLPIAVAGVDAARRSISLALTTDHQGVFLAEDLLPGVYTVTAPGLHGNFILTTPSSHAITLTTTFTEDLGLNFGYQSPTGIAVQQFEVAATDGRVVLTWATLAARPAGFHVWRADNRKGIGEMRLTGQPIAETTAGVYRFADATALPGQSYWYWLADALTGARCGPAALAGRQGSKLFLPTMMNR
jgi:hypothetical protein